MFYKQAATKYFIVIFMNALVLTLAACGGTAGEEQSVANRETGNIGEGELYGWLEAEDGEADANFVAIPTDTSPDSAADAPNEPQPAAASIQTDSSTTAINNDGLQMGYTDDGHAYLGDPNAAIVMEEFSDFQCPYCSRFAAQTLPSLLENQIAAGEVVLIYYDFPLYSIHPQAEGAANASRCAGELGGIEAYWAYHDLLFSRNDEWTGANPNGTFIRFGTELGLAEADFSECVQNGRHVDAVTADYNLGISRGVSSTPSFFLNDQMLAGAQPVAVFNQAFDTLLAGGSIVPETADFPEYVPPTAADIPTSPDTVAFALGDPNAPLQIVEYTDYQCPYCQQHSQETLPQILSELIEDGRVYYVFKDFPLDQLHPQARDAAKAVRCGGEQDAFLEMHDAVFNNQGTWAGQASGLEQLFTDLALEIGLSEEQFAGCYQSDEMDRLVEANLVEGQQFGVSGTPAFFFNGYQAAGALPFDSFEQITVWAENGELDTIVEENARAAYERAKAQQAQQAQQPQAPPTPAGPIDVPISESHAIGDPDAPVTIVEYTDYQCPYCSRHFAQTFPRLKEQYIDTGLVYYVFKDFPISSIHPQAVLASEAARCAGDQEAYLGMHDMLFAKQGEWNGRNDAATLFSGYAAELGLDTASFDECLTSRQFETAVEADFNEGRSFGIQGTPTFFLNGQRLVGAQPLEVFEQMILSLSNSDTN